MEETNNKGKERRQNMSKKLLSLLSYSGRKEITSQDEKYER